MTLNVYSKLTGIEEKMFKYSTLPMPDIKKEDRKEIKRKAMYYNAKQNECLVSGDHEEVIFSTYLKDEQNVKVDNYSFKAKLNYNISQWYAIVINDRFLLTKQQLKDLITELM